MIFHFQKNGSLYKIDKHFCSSITSPSQYYVQYDVQSFQKIRKTCLSLPLHWSHLFSRVPSLASLIRPSGESCIQSTSHIELISPSNMHCRNSFSASTSVAKPKVCGSGPKLLTATFIKDPRIMSWKSGVQKTDWFSRVDLKDESRLMCILAYDKQN